MKTIGETAWGGINKYCTVLAYLQCMASLLHSEVILPFFLSKSLHICTEETKSVEWFDFEVIISHACVPIALPAPCAKNPYINTHWGAYICEWEQYQILYSSYLKTPTNMCEIQTSNGKITLAQSPTLIFAAHIVSLHVVLVYTDLIHPENCLYSKQCEVRKRSRFVCKSMQTLRDSHFWWKLNVYILTYFHFCSSRYIDSGLC